MGVLMKLLSGSWKLEALPVPWPEGPSIHGHILAHVKPGEPGLAPGGETLPDEARVFGEEQLRWVAGGLDGAFGHHGGAGAQAELASAVLGALTALLRQASAENLKALYDLLVSHHALELVDPLLQGVVGANLNVRRLHRLATYLVTHAPDREPVKLGLALLGLFSPSPDRELLVLMGRHEELTLFAATALANTVPDRDAALLELARHVHGWGRIATVERLAGTRDPKVRAWLLREGYRNSVMNEYLAHFCATTGCLVEALEAGEVDEALLAGAGDLLVAMIAAPGSAFEGIDAFADGATALRLYLGHLRERASTVDHFLAAHAIAAFFEDEDADWDERAGRGFTPGLRAALQAVAEAIVARPSWRELVLEELEASEPERFYRADEAARVLGIDTFELHLARLDALRSPSWYHAARTDDPERLARFLDAARQRLRLDEIATGPARSLGMGPEHEQHAALDFVLQALPRLPGQGWELVRAALASPVVRNRSGAAKVLASWGKQAWPREAESALLEAAAREPDEDLRARLERLLSTSEPVN